MPHSIRFLVLILPNTDAKRQLERFKYVEKLGFDVAATADHFVDWTNPPSDWLEAWTLLGAVARETSCIRLTSCVSQIPLRHPAMFARQALTVDHLSSGRLDVGIGIGINIDPSYNMMGIPNWTAKQRVDRFKEYICIVDSLLSNEVTDYHGDYYKIAGAYMNPRPLQQPRPPILIAAMGPVMISIAAKHADTWNSLSFEPSFDTQFIQTRQRIEHMRQCCEKLGRDPDSLRISYQMFDTNARNSGGKFNYYASEQLFIDMVSRFAELGVSEFGVYFPMSGEQLPMFEQIARDTIPTLRKHLS